MIFVLEHRGGREDRKRDENSLSAFRAAFESCDGIETDVDVSADGVAYLIHETRTSRLPPFKSVPDLRRLLDAPSAAQTGKRRFDDLSAGDIDALRLKQGEKIPRLAALFQLAAAYPGKTINLELKTPKAVGPVLAEIAAAVAGGLIRPEHVIISSFDSETVAAVRRRDPQLAIGVVFGRHTKPDAASLGKLQPDYLIFRGQNIPRPSRMAAIIKACPRAKIMIWRNGKAAACRKILRGLQGTKTAYRLHAVITDDPAALRRQLSPL